MTERGLLIAGPGGFVQPGCEPTRGAFAFAVARNDWNALSACIERLLAQTQDRTVVLSAEPDIDYAEFLSAMDAVRVREDRVLADDVLISAGPR